MGRRQHERLESGLREWIEWRSANASRQNTGNKFWSGSYKVSKVATSPTSSRRRGMDIGYPAPPAQTRTCGFPASGSSVALAFAQEMVVFNHP